MEYQKTLANAVVIEGTGLHTGTFSQVIVKPADANTGIVFQLYDDSGVVHFVKANPMSVRETRQNVAIGNKFVRVKTVEHLLSALFGLGIDNCVIEVKGVEIPILDGSAKEFVKHFKKAGIVELKRVKNALELPYPVWIADGEKHLVFLPSDKLSISYEIFFPEEVIGTQSFYYEHSPENYEKAIAPARTFGFVEDVKMLEKKGLVSGASVKNVLAFSRRKNKPLNSPRFKDEPVRHKILDLMGVLALLGGQVKARIIARRSGHSLDVRVARKIVISRELHAKEKAL